MYVVRWTAFCFYIYGDCIFSLCHVCWFVWCEFRWILFLSQSMFCFIQFDFVSLMLCFLFICFMCSDSFPLQYGTIEWKYIPVQPNIQRTNWEAIYHKWRCCCSGCGCCCCCCSYHRKLKKSSFWSCQQAGVNARTQKCYSSTI